MLNVITVRTGNRYGAEYVQKMRNMLTKHLQIPHILYCLTDNPTSGTGAVNIRVPQYLNGWWNKLYLFSSFMPPGPLLYLDLDQIILGDITEIVQECLRHPFSCYSDHIEWCGVKLGTAFMTLESGSFAKIFEDFWQKADAIMRQYEQGGDQVYLGQHLTDVYYFDEDWPDAVKSYKYDLRGKGQQPGADVKICNFHGFPKMHDILDEPLVKEHWQ